jgi:uncharacterized protein (DUF2252 family)
MVTAPPAFAARGGLVNRRLLAALAAASLGLLVVPEPRLQASSACQVASAAVPAAAPGAQPPGPAPSPLWPEEAALAQVSPELLEQLRSDPYVYFRFINRQWTRRVCERFTDVIPSLATVRLHGDAHLEQYAYTDVDRGLDDFDDSATGPSVVDVSRFLASVDLVLRRHGWSGAYPTAAEAFLAGYRKGLTVEGYLPPDPAIVTRLRQRPRRDTIAFLQWADSLMIPIVGDAARLLPTVEAAIDEFARRMRPGLPQDYFRIKRSGYLKMGVGSALTTKVLLRVEGPSSAAEDDVVIEAKRASSLGGVPCLTVPPAAEAVRVVAGTRQIGRLHNEVLMVLPKLGDAGFGTWWVRSWSPSYVEVDIDDYVSPNEIVEVAHDVGAQLGSRNLKDDSPQAQAQGRRAEGQTVEQMERRIRDRVADLTAELFEAWSRFRSQPVP